MSFGKGKYALCTTPGALTRAITRLGSAQSPASIDENAVYGYTLYMNIPPLTERMVPVI